MVSTTTEITTGDLCITTINEDVVGHLPVRSVTSSKSTIVTPLTFLGNVIERTILVIDAIALEASTVATSRVVVTNEVVLVSTLAIYCRILDAQVISKTL